MLWSKQRDSSANGSKFIKSKTSCGFLWNTSRVIHLACNLVWRRQEDLNLFKCVYHSFVVIYDECTKLQFIRRQTGSDTSKIAQFSQCQRAVSVISLFVNYGHYPSESDLSGYPFILLFHLF